MTNRIRPPTRRQFLTRCGTGAVTAGLGVAVADRLSWNLAFGASAGGLEFGALEPLVDLLQETAPDALMEKLSHKLRDGLDLSTLVAAGALANARTFGGEDYDGYHIQMALVPAFEMSQQMPAAVAALPVLKVLHRNSRRIQSFGDGRRETLAAVAADGADGSALVTAMRDCETETAEQHLAALAATDRDRAYNLLQIVMQDELDVHRVVLSWRAFEGLRHTGPEHSVTMLRQSLRMCIDREQARRQRGRATPAIREDLPQLLQEFNLETRAPGQLQGDDAWVEQLAATLFHEEPRTAATKVAQALGDGYSPECIGEAMSLAATDLLLHDPGRTRADEGKPVGSVHGASVGVHASDSANAWRHIAEVTNARNVAASMIAGAYHTAGQAHHCAAKPFDDAKASQQTTAKALLQELDERIGEGDQQGASRAARQYARQGHDVADAFPVFLKYAVSEDGALHAEKYFLTAHEECHRTRPAFRERHLAAIARVSASERGFPAPGVDHARQLLSA